MTMMIMGTRWKNASGSTWGWNPELQENLPQHIIDAALEEPIYDALTDTTFTVDQIHDDYVVDIYEGNKL